MSSPARPAMRSRSPRRSGSGASGPEEISLRYAIVGARAVERDDAGRDRRRSRGPRVQPLRPVRGHRAGRGVRVRRGASRLARQRGPLPARGRRSRERRAAGRGRGRRARLHCAHEAGAAAHPLLDGRPREPLVRAVQLRSHARPHERDPRQDRRHAHHPRGERVPDAGRGRARPLPGAGAPLPARRRPGGDAGHGRGAGRADRGLLPLRRQRALGRRRERRRQTRCTRCAAASPA